jgi:hypothetical protein
MQEISAWDKAVLTLVAWWWCAAHMRAGKVGRA